MASIAGFYEVGHLLGRFRIDDAAEARRTAAGGTNHPPIIGNHTDLNATDTRVTSDHLFRVVCLEFVEMSVVKQTV
jgi:hypothetical protein